MIDWLRSNWIVAYAIVFVVVVLLIDWRTHRRRGMDISEAERRWREGRR